MHDLMVAYLVVLSCALYDSGCGHTQSPAMIACEVMYVEQLASGSQGSSVWLVQLVLRRLCSNEQTLFHPFSLVGCQGCCKLSFLPSLPQ